MLRNFIQRCGIGLISVCVLHASLAEAGEVSTKGTPDLVGTGHLEFPLDDAAFADFGPALAESRAKVTVTIGSDGGVIDCVAPDDTATTLTSFTRQICDVIQREGQFSPSSWYAPNMRGGRLDIGVGAEQSVVPAKPIRFVEAPTGTLLSLMLYDGQCMDLSPSMAKADSDEVCAAFQAAGYPGLQGDSLIQSAQLRFELEKGAHSFLFYTFEQISDKGNAVDFGVELPASEKMLGPADGRLNASIRPMDYPTRALRYDIEGKVELLLGYDNTGVARSCQPLTSSNTTFLGNATCRSVLRKTRYTFTSSHAQFEGLRYMIIPIRWTLPSDR